VGIGIGVLAGRFRDTPIDLAGRLFGIFIYAAPIFFLGLLLQLLFSSKLGWLPASGRVSPLTEFTLQKVTHIYTIDSIITGNWSALGDTLQHLILPAVTLGLVISGVMIRLVRVNLMQTLRGAYVE